MEIINEILEWYRRKSTPGVLYKYSRCPICNNTWWDDKEEHNFNCWIPRLEEMAKINNDPPHSEVV
jgi:hypothetical protein